MRPAPLRGWPCSQVGTGLIKPAGSDLAPFASPKGFTMKRLYQFICGEDGPAAVEYAVMLALIVGAALSGITSFGQATYTSFQDSSTKIDAAVTGSASPGN